MFCCFRQDPSDLKTLAQLISAYSKFDSQKAQLYPLFVHCLTHTVSTHIIDAYLAPDYAAIFVAHLVCVIHLERKLNKIHLVLYQVINQPCQLKVFPGLLCFHYHVFALIYNWLILTVCITEPLKW